MQLFLIAPLLVALAHTASTSYNCFWCKNFESSSAVPFDANCGQDGYSGNKIEEDWSEKCCYTKVYDDGGVVRSGCQGEDNGECKDGTDDKGHYNECYCIGDSCNNDQCPDCGGPTPTGPVATTTTKKPNPGGDYQCYYCNNYDENSKVPYDAACGNDGYTGNAADQDGDDQCCYTLVYDNGNVMRTGCGGHDDGECREGNGWTGCYCQGDKCNKDVCQDCGADPPTPVTNPTDGPTEPGKTTTTTPSGPSLGLSCYTCMDCPSVDDDTNTISDPTYNSCFTVLVSSSHVVYRGGSPDHHNDGDCSMVDGNMSCYCISDNCNGDDAK